MDLRRVWLVLRAVLIPLCLFLPLALPAPAAAPPAKLEVFVSILPQVWFVERIGGDRVNVSVLVGPGQSPHTFEPSPKQMTALASARAFFAIGMPFEATLVPKVKSAFPNVLVVDTRSGVELRTITEREVVRDEPGRVDGDHAELSAGDADPHFWLNPRLAKTSARTIRDTLKSLDPSGAAVYDANLAALNTDLDAVDKRIAAALAPWKGKEFFVYHPAFGYFADAYGLKQTAVETGGKEPGAKDLARLIDRARADGVKVIFVQPQFSARGANAVAEAIGGVVVPIDDLAPDYLDNLQRLASRIEDAVKPAPPTGSAPPAPGGGLP